MEKTLLCWSVMGWPSTEKEFEAWSPNPWKRPFESAATPGDARVTSELRVDEALSSGSLVEQTAIHVSMRGRVVLKQIRSHFHGDRSRCGADFHVDIGGDRQHRVDIDVCRERSETILRDRQVIGIEGEVREMEMAGSVGGCRSGVGADWVLDRHGRAWDDGSRRVGYCAAD